MDRKYLSMLLIMMSALLLWITCRARGTETSVEPNSFAVWKLAYTPLIDYMPDEIIVKFRRGIAAAMETALAGATPTGDLQLSYSLNALNQEYRLSKAEPLFKNFRQKTERVKALLQKDPALLTQQEKRILKRRRRAPEDANVPDLDRIYKLELQLDANQVLEQAVAAYNRDPDVGYAELNHIVFLHAGPPQVEPRAPPTNAFAELKYPRGKLNPKSPSSMGIQLPPAERRQKSALADR
ncbi:MAG: hypothetical protein ACYS76_05875 [Planctomycetota bacterium]|jgi:hypothetical protein